jgi:4-hydroxy-4-methyl-2-oxoglutarate aldolase
MKKIETSYEIFKDMSSTLLSDAMGRGGAMDYQIKLVSQGTTMIGRAFTVDLDKGDNLFLHKAIYEADEDAVLIVAGKGFEFNAYLGELMSLAAQARGLKGIVIDGMVRDKTALEKMSIPIFARGFIPSGPYKNGPGDINSTVQCGGISVAPMDYIFGDEDGVVVIPQDQLDVILTKASEKLDYENKRIIEISKSVDENGYLLEGKIIEPPAWLNKEED